MAWTKERLAALLAPLPATSLDAALGFASITVLREITGEVGANCVLCPENRSSTSYSAVKLSAVSILRSMLRWVGGSLHPKTCIMKLN